MFNTDTEMLFPMRVIPSLGDMRGQEWQTLIAHLSDEHTEDKEIIALTTLVVKLAGCAGCNTDSFRAMKGCTQCARLIIKRFKGNDAELIRSYQDCQKEVNSYLSKRDQ
jgi:hypothetical protein